MNSQSPVLLSDQRQRVQLRLWQDSWKKARRGSQVTGSDIASQLLNIFSVGKQRAEQAEGQPSSFSKGTGRDIPPTSWSDCPNTMSSPHTTLCQVPILLFRNTFLYSSAIQKVLVTQGNIRKLRATVEMGRMRHSFQKEQRKEAGQGFGFPMRKPGTSQLYLLTGCNLC